MDINLAKYIEYYTKKGIPQGAIKQSLVKAGWKEAVVDAALNSQSLPHKSNINLKMWTGPVILALTS